MLDLARRAVRPMQGNVGGGATGAFVGARAFRGGAVALSTEW